MNRRFQREIEEKEGLLKDLENTVDLKIVQLAHHKQELVNIKDYYLQYRDSNQPVFTDLTFSISQGERIACSQSDDARTSLYMG